METAGRCIRKVSPINNQLLPFLMELAKVETTAGVATSASGPLTNLS